jgi:hypothetical protein
MRIRMLQTPRQTCIDGIRLDRFEPGQEYEVGISLAALFLAEGWAEPIFFADPPEPPPADIPSFDEGPPNLTRERYPLYVDALGIAQDLDRRRQRRSKSIKKVDTPKKRRSR